MKSNLKIALLVVSLMGSSQVFAQECKATRGAVTPNFCVVNLKDGKPVSIRVTGVSSFTNKWIVCQFDNAFPGIKTGKVTYSAPSIGFSGVVPPNDFEIEGKELGTPTDFTFTFSTTAPDSHPFRFACTELWEKSK